MSGEAETAQNKEPSPKRLYVGNLAFATNEENLKALFEGAGELESARIVRSRGGRSRGFGIVEFADEAAAQEAITKFNEHEFEGRNILVRIDEPKRGNRPDKPDTPSAKIFVGNLPFAVTSEKLSEVFGAENSELVKAEVASDRQSGRSRGFGTVQYNTVEEAEAAIKTFDNQELEGRAMRVRFDRRGGRK